MSSSHSFNFPKNISHPENLLLSILLFLSHPDLSLFSSVAILKAFFATSLGESVENQGLEDSTDLLLND